jgi:hypothetical protein
MIRKLYFEPNQEDYRKDDTGTGTNQSNRKEYGIQKTLSNFRK